MTAIDPSTADRILAIPTSPFTALPWGDATFIPYGFDMEPAPGGAPVGVSPLGNPGIIYGESNEAVLADLTGFTPSDDWTIIVAVEGPTDEHQAAVDVVNIGGAFVLSTFFGIETAEVFATINGDETGQWIGSEKSPITVYAVTGNVTESFITFAGEGTLWQGPGGSPAGMGGPVVIDGYTHDVGQFIHLVGLWMWEGVAFSQQDASDTVNAIAAAMGGTVPDPRATVDIVASAAFDASARIDAPVEVAVDMVASAALEVTAEDPPEIELPAPPELVPGGTQEPPEPPVFIIPPGVPDPIIKRISQTFPAPVLNAAGAPVNWEATSEVRQDFGRWQLVVNGIDVTWINGVKTPIPVYRRGQPFGATAMVLRLPQFTPFQPRPAWAVKGANMMLIIRRIGGGDPIRAWSGLVERAESDQDSGEITLTGVGYMHAVDRQLRLPTFNTAPQDIGRRIADVLNQAVSRRYHWTEPVTTGLRSSVMGGWENLTTGYVQRLLSTAITGGRQWTVSCEHQKPVIHRKDTTTAHWTIRSGQPGMEIKLADDGLESPNRIFVQWTNTDGGRGRNAKFPNWKPDQTPPFPNTNASRSMRYGWTDAMTSTGNGVSMYQRQIGQPVTGRFSRSDEAATRRLQRGAGILVDGIAGPQTWATAFQAGANSGTLGGAFIMPAAAAPEVVPHRYGPDGAKLGPNPRYNPAVVVVDRYIDLGYGVSRQEAISEAEKILARDAGPGWQGVINLTMDPPGGSMWEIREGQNIRVQGWHGENVLVQVASVEGHPEANPPSVRLTVDSKARDKPTLDAIRAREREATDPAREALNRITTTTIASSTPTFDAESPAGTLVEHAVFSNLWSVRPVPMGKFGEVRETMVRTFNPASEFALAAFARPVTAAQLLSVVGNPLGAGPDEDPWTRHSDALKRRFGFMTAWGWREQPAGYHPRQKSNPAGNTTAPITGRLEDASSWEFATANGETMYVAVIANRSCWVRGQFKAESRIGW